MHTTRKSTILATLLSLLAFTPVLAQDHNVTVADTDPSITYTGAGTGDASICKLDANGNLFGGQPGCYFFPTKCTSSVAMSQNLDHNASATFKFKGSAIYINSALNEISPIYAVTLDGQSTDVDGVRPSPGFTCATLFSQTILDPTVEHTIRLSVRGPSPTRNTTQDPDGTALVFSLIDFIYTVPDSASTSNGTSTPTTGTSTGANAGSTTPAGSNSTPQANTAAGAGAPSPAILFSAMLSLRVGAMLGATVLSIL